MRSTLERIYLTKVLGENFEGASAPQITRVVIKNVYVGGPQAGEDIEVYDKTNSDIQVTPKLSKLLIRVRTPDRILTFETPTAKVRHGAVQDAATYTWSEKDRAYMGAGIGEGQKTVTEGLLAGVSVFPQKTMGLNSGKVRVTALPPGTSPKSSNVQVGQEYRVFHKIGDSVVVMGDDGRKVTLPGNCVISEGFGMQASPRVDPSVYKPKPTELMVPRKTASQQGMALKNAGIQFSFKDDGGDTGWFVFQTPQQKIAAEQILNPGQQQTPAQAPITPQTPTSPESPVTESITKPRFVLYGDNTGRVYGMSGAMNIQAAWEELQSRVLDTVTDKNNVEFLNPRIVKNASFFAVEAPGTPEREFGLVDLQTNDPRVQAEVRRLGLATIAANTLANKVA